jgi:hypothetical protein
MRARIFIEVELDDKVLIDAFGEKLPELVASHIFEERLAAGAAAVLRSFNGAKEVKAIYIPEMITGDRILTAPSTIIP